MVSDNPILNSPYSEPLCHYATEADGSLNYQDVRRGRRIFSPDIQLMPVKQGPQQSLFEINEFEVAYGENLINLCRKEIGRWRAEKYPNTTQVSLVMRLFWFEIASK
jgi:type III restriction enzyme